MKINPRIYLIAFGLFLCVHFSSTSQYNDNYGRLIYLEFTSPVVSALPPIASQNNLLATQSDDSPFTRVKLPWAFNLFGNKIYNIFVSPNGAIHQTYDQPCVCACFGSQGTCGFNKSYFGIIAGYLADLNPSQSLKTANITSYMSGNMVSIIYKSVPFFNRTASMSFRISLFNDSSVVIDYDSIYPLQTYSKWLTGMRSPQYSSHTNYTSTQLTTGRTDWSTTVPGLYPAKKNVISGSQYSICPISRVWGASPGSLNVTAVEGSNIMLTLIPLQYSCPKRVDIVFYVKSSAALTAASSDLAPCVAHSGSMTTLLCNISSLPSSVLVPGSVSGMLAWRVKGSGSSYTKMLVDSIPLTFYSSQVSGSALCSLNAPAQNCISTQLCAGNFTCLHLPCDKNKAVLYKNPTCGNATAASDTNTCSIDLAYNHYDNQCCTIEQQDCTGKCFGKSMVGFSGVGSKTLMCCVGQTVDCTGVCAGKVVVDACGVCGGNDASGLYCNIKVAISTGYGYNALFSNIDYSQPHQLWALGSINITNQNSSEIVVNITVVGHNDMGPQITVGSLVGKTVIPAYSWRTFSVNVSLTSLYNGVTNYWEVKTLLVNYYRLSVSQFEYSFPVSVFPSASNCSAITSVSTCMRIPACIFCADYPSLRILRAAGEDYEGYGRNGEYMKYEGYEGYVGERSYGVGRVDGMEYEGNDSNTTVEERYYNSRRQYRQLYTGLVPPQLDNSGYPILSGVCTDGFLTSSCVPYSSGSILRSSWVSTAIAVLLLFALNLYL